MTTLIGGRCSIFSPAAFINNHEISAEFGFIFFSFFTFRAVSRKLKVHGGHSEKLDSHSDWLTMAAVPKRRPSSIKRERERSSSLFFFLADVVIGLRLHFDGAINESQ